ncbi:MAG TPA: heavy-metal-associated domain-containing protein [Prolixibacteraceae bacterium]|nr:heavy-metal-associated domain-containing protein [Prolixibacteraceae bacterium]
MGTLKFKTNVNCGGCIATITPHMNQVIGIEKWSVDTANPQKILTVKAIDLQPEVIVETLKNAGYKAEPVG